MPCGTRPSGTATELRSPEKQSSGSIQSPGPTVRQRSAQTAPGLEKSKMSAVGTFAGIRTQSIAKALLVMAGMSVASAALAAPPPWSNSRHNRSSYDGYDYAPVVRTEPIVRQVRVETPRRECWDDVQTVESRPHISNPAVGGRTLLGGIIGGVIGHQFGSGSGRDAATIVGAAIGAGVGYDSARRAYGEREEQVVQRCQVRYEDQYEERIDGYRVTYQYNGREFTTRLPYDPGDRIRVRVAVAPAE